MPNIVKNIYKTIAKCMLYTLTFYQTDILPLFFHHLETNAGEWNLETAKSFLTSAKKLLLEVPRAAPQHQLYQTVPSELQPFTFYLGDKKILVAKFSAVKKYICHQKLEWKNLLCEKVTVHDLSNASVKDS